MQKINFQNLPSTETPLNATNLNQLQQNVENEFNNTKIIKRKGFLNYATDFNTVTEPGYYCYSGYSGQNTGSHRPTDVMCHGFLIVMDDATFNTRIQIFFSPLSTIKIKRRMFYDGVWHDWVE